jgi:uncharacterized protein YkwD
MRTILYIFTILFTTTAIGQTKLDTLVFNEINNYRVSKGLEKVELNNAFYTEALNHCNYMILKKQLVMMDMKLDTILLRMKLQEWLKQHLKQVLLLLKNTVNLQNIMKL